MDMKMDVKFKSNLEVYDSCKSGSFFNDDQESPLSREYQTETDSELEDEPLVPLESVTVPQQLMQVDLEPSLILFVNAEPKSISTTNKPSTQSADTLVTNDVNDKLNVVQQESSTSREEDIAVRKSITKALRNVKRNKKCDEITSCTNVDNFENNETFKKSKVYHDRLSSHNVEDDYHSKNKCMSPNDKKKRRKGVRTKVGDIKKQLGKKVNKNSSRSCKNKTRKGKTSNGKENCQNLNVEDSKTNILKNDSELTNDHNEKKSKAVKNNGRMIEKELIRNKLGQQENFNCEICGNEFESLIDLESHSECHETKKPESFECTVCCKKFKEKSHLATHSRAHIEIRNFKCDECGSLFKTKTNLYFHMKTHEEAPFICEKCNKTFSERKILMRHIRVVHSGEGVYNCDQCGRSFKNGHNLELHYTLHSGNKPFTCDVCDKSFVYKSTYTTHMKAHEADNQFNCELCPSDVADKAELRRRCSHHSEARPWLCSVCGKGYPLKSTLKHHVKTHNPEKPFKCNECGKSFMKKSSYECHMKSHSGENPPYMCDQCSQSYYNVFALKRHYLKHTSERKFICDICNKAFWMKDALKVHKRSHANIKMFQCHLCSSSFVHKHNLMGHLRSHSVDQQFSCSVCPKTFSHKYNLDRHQRQHAVPILNPPPLSPSFMMVGPPKHLEFPTLHVL